MSEKARRYKGRIELLIEELERMSSVFNEEITINSLYAVEKMAEEALKVISPAVEYVNKLSELSNKHGGLETLEKRMPEAAKDLYLLAGPILDTCSYLSRLKASSEFHRRRLGSFGRKELKQDLPYLFIEMEEFKEVNRTKLKYRIKILKHLIRLLS